VMSAVPTASRGRVRFPYDEAEDEALAAAARASYLRKELADLGPDRRMRAVLDREERMIAERRRASVRHLTGVRSAPMSGRLAITSHRLVLVKREPITLAAHEELDDTCLIAYRVHVLLTTGIGFAIEALRPRLLRVELAEARAQWLEAQAGRSETEPSAEREVWPRR